MSKFLVSTSVNISQEEQTFRSYIEEITEPLKSPDHELLIEASSQIKGLSAVISKEWTEEAEASSSIIQIYCNPRVLLCTIRDAEPHETFYDPKVGVNVMSKTLADHISSEPLTFSRKHLKWING